MVALTLTQLTRAIDAIAQYMTALYFGRFDVRFDTLHNLSAGRAFSVMDFNGAGSEAFQAWDSDIGVPAGFRMIFKKQRTLFAVSNAMRCRGFKPLGVLGLAK